MVYRVRPVRAGDAPAIADIMRQAIHEIGSRAYSPEQVVAWSSRAFTPQRVLERLDAGSLVWVAAEEADRAVAYVLLESDGHLDHLYCIPDHAGRGLAKQLLLQAEQHARTLECDRLFTEASELARPAFERAGYTVSHRRDFTIPYQGAEVAIHNYAMEKALT